MKAVQLKGIDVQEIKKNFPIFQRKIHGYDLIYLDSAASSQKPREVLHSMQEFYERYNSNIHRGVYKLSEEATLAYEEAHQKVADFIHADQEEIIFTKNTTESINLVAYSLLLDLKKGDEVVLTEMEHHSNLVPWQQLCKMKGLTLKYIPVDREGRLQDYTLSKKTKIVAVTHVSNALGTINPVHDIIKKAHEVDAVTVVDGAQAVPHMAVNMKQLDADFYAFSGHKMLGPLGIGVLYGKKALLETMRPFLYGGDMIQEVSYQDTTFNALPWKFEAGTPHVAGGIGLGVAVDYLQKIGMDTIREHEIALKQYAVARFQELKGVTIIGMQDAQESGGILSFTLDKIHPHDVSSVLDQYGICIRGGHHCAMPLMKKFGLQGTCRASFYVYNDREDIDKLVDGLQKVHEVFQ